ncbi:MAG: GtrA family protein [Kiritimatiellae bacterium]|nr:GtrA family protein [Kiritimatiellia bacterium]
MRLRIPWAWTGDLVRYAMAGITAAIADLTVYVLLNHFGWHPLAAHLVSRPVGGLVSFSVNRWWTFGGRRFAWTLAGQLWRYGLVWVGAYLTTELLIWIYLRWIPDRPVTVKVMAELTAGFIAFWVQRHWTYRGERAQPRR